MVCAILALVSFNLPWVLEIDVQGNLIMTSLHEFARLKWTILPRRMNETTKYTQFHCPEIQSSAVTYSAYKKINDTLLALIFSPQTVPLTK